MSKKNAVVNTNQSQIIEPDSVRIGIRENVIQLEFAQTKCNDNLQDNEQNKNFLIVANIRLNPKYLQSFMVNIIEAGIKYEKTFNVDIGFTPFWKPETENI